MLRERRDWILE
jgi:hypothetical protein